MGKKRSLPLFIGHHEGYKSFQKILNIAPDIGTQKYHTVYTFQLKTEAFQEDERSSAFL